MANTKHKIFKVLRFTGKVLLGVFIFLIILLLFIRSPWGQNLIKDKLVSSLEKKTGAEINLERLFIEFNGDIEIRGLYLEDPKGDTLIYSESLSASIAPGPLISGTGFSLNDLDWNNVRANIIRKDSVSGFNFEFLVDAFGAGDSQAKPADQDTTSSPMNISLGDFNLTNFNVVFRDDVTGIDSKYEFQRLELELNGTDLQNMVFRAEDGLLENADINYTQTKPIPESNKEPPPSPVISTENLKLKNVNASYISQPDSLDTEFDIADLELEDAEFDLKRSSIKGGLLRLEKSAVRISMEQNTAKEPKSSGEDSFEWPQWNVAVENIALTNNDFDYFLNGERPKSGQFNPNAISVDSLIFLANGLKYEDKKAVLNIDKFNFKEASGLHLNEFDLNALVSDEMIQISGINVSANNNSIQGNINLSYNKLVDFINNPGNSKMDLNLDSIFFDVRELFRFQPALKDNQYISALASAPIKGEISASGFLNDLNLQNLRLNWNNTSIKGRGNLNNVEDPENLKYKLSEVNINSTRKDLAKFVKEEDLGVRLPEHVSLTGSFQGSTEEIITSSKLLTSEGSLKMDGSLKMGEDIVFDAKVEGDSIALGNLLQNEALGKIQLKMDVSGTGGTVNTLNAKLKSDISSFTYNGYEFRGINLSGNIKDGEGPLDLNYKDENLNMELRSNLELDSVAPRIDFNLNLKGADLGALGITSRNIKTGFQLEGWFEGNAEKFDAVAEIIDGVAVYNNESYLLGNFEAMAYVRPDTTSVKIDNMMLNMDLRSNADPASITSAINRHFKRYISSDFEEDSITSPVNLVLDAQIRESPILTEVFLVNLTDLDTVDINVDFREAERAFDAAINIPFLEYYSSQLDSLVLDLKSDPENLNFQFAFNSLDAGPLAIKRTIVDGKVINSKLNLDFTSFYEGKRIVHLNSDLNFEGDTLQFHINPKELILNSNPWDIPESNEIRFDTEYLAFNDFQLSRNNQEMRISAISPQGGREQIRLDFQNFKLAPLLSYLNPEDQLATGNINGNFIFEEPFGESGIIADMSVNQLEVLDVNLSTLSLEGSSSGFNNYDFKMAINGGEVDLDLNGTYSVAEESPVLDLDLDLNEIEMSAVEGFSQGAINDASGSLSGKIELSGTLTDPVYEGNINFNQTKFNVAYLNTAFKLPDEQLNLNQDAINFDDFEIQDLDNNSIFVNGKIITKNLLNPGFDLKLKAKDFRVLNASEGANELFYGKAVVDVDADIKGDLNLPVVDMKLTINEKTDFTYIVPETEVRMQERDGVVIFVNKENPNAILSETEEQSYVASGYEIKSRLKVAQGAKFTMIINEDTGDRFQVQGKGDLIFNMDPNGRLSLTGIYEINKGFYEMSLYNLVSRRFDIADGSRVSWSGDPLGAQLDVSAIYRVETSASSLMASQLSGADQSVEDRYRRELPFQVYLNIDGEITEPDITFSLDMPEEEQGVFGGQVYGRIRQLNDHEDELNKQVFSLLVLNRFFPAGGNDGSSGGTLSVARDNLNDALSDQLNALSQRLLGNSGVQLNFQLDSYTDYQGETAEERTQLDITAEKSFLDDRLIVQVGSEVDIEGGNQPGQETSPIIGNVSIAYLLDKNGNWRIKGFNKNQYENVIDGQVIVSGIALIFTKEFNKFKNIFEKAVMEEVKPNEENAGKQEDKKEGNSENDQKEENED